MSEKYSCETCKYQNHNSLDQPCVTCTTEGSGATNYAPKQKSTQDARIELRHCEDCKYKNLRSDSVPCDTCLNKAYKPNFKPKQEETMPEEKVPAMGAAMPRQESATDAVAKIMVYSHPLYEAFDDAVKQATKGKGERHGGDKTPFMEQRWHNIAKSTGVGGLMFQMIKKAEEACEKDDQEAFERELLGALVYGGAAYLYVKKHGFKK